MPLILSLLLSGATGYLMWKELEARHNLERIRLTESFQAVATQQLFGFVRRFFMAMCFVGACIAFFYVLSPESMDEAFHMMAAIVERASAPR